MSRSPFFCLCLFCTQIQSIIFSAFRLVQKAELTRLSHTFLHVPQLHWIVVEDSPHKTPLVTDFLKKSGLTYTHLHMSTAKDRKLQEVALDFSSSQSKRVVSFFLFYSVFFTLCILIQIHPALFPPLTSGWPELAEATWCRAKERGPAVAARGQEGSARRRRPAGGGVLRWRWQHVQPADFWGGGVKYVCPLQQGEGLRLLVYYCAPQDVLKQMVPFLVPDEEHSASVSVASGAGRRDEIWEARCWGRKGLYMRTNILFGLLSL